MQKKERIFKLCDAGFTVYEIAKALELDVESVREIVPASHIGRRNKDYMILQQILCELKEEQRLSNLRASAAHATAATIESEALALLLQRVQVLQQKQQESQLATKESYELCAILKTTQPLLQDNAQAQQMQHKALIDVKFI